MSSNDHMVERLSTDSALPALIKFVSMAIATSLIAHYGAGPTRDHEHVIYLWLGIALLSPLLVFELTYAPALK